MVGTRYCCSYDVMGSIFLEGAIQKITDQKRITTRELDFDEFNKRAVDYAKTKSKEEIIGEAIQYRGKF